MDNRWTFDNDELFDLVACGKKHGTCSLLLPKLSKSKMSLVRPMFIHASQRFPQISADFFNVFGTKICSNSFLYKNAICQ